MNHPAEPQQASPFAAMPMEILTPEQLAQRLQVKRSWVYEQTRYRADVRNADPLPLPARELVREPTGKRRIQAHPQGERRITRCNQESQLISEPEIRRDRGLYANRYRATDSWFVAPLADSIRRSCVYSRRHLSNRRQMR